VGPPPTANARSKRKIGKGDNKGRGDRGRDRERERHGSSRDHGDRDYNHRNVTRITTNERRYSKHWNGDRREEGGSKGERPVMTEERDERTEQVRITLTFLMFSAAYNLQRVRYRRAHVPGGEPLKDNGLGRRYARGGEIMITFWILVSLVRYLLHATPCPGLYLVMDSILHVLTSNVPDLKRAPADQENAFMRLPRAFGTP